MKTKPKKFRRNQTAVLTPKPRIAPSDSATRVRTAIREWILNGENKFTRGSSFQSTQLIDEKDELCQRLSRSVKQERLTAQPIRSALSMLVGEGLIVAHRDRKNGFEVKRVRNGVVAFVAAKFRGDFVGGVVDGINKALAEKNNGPGDTKWRLLCITPERFGAEPDDEAKTKALDQLIVELARETDGIILLPSGTMDQMDGLRKVMLSGKVSPNKEDKEPSPGLPVVLLGKGNSNETGRDRFIDAVQIVFDEGRIANEICLFVERIVRDQRLEQGTIAVIGERRNDTLYTRANGIFRRLQVLQERCESIDLLYPSLQKSVGEDAGVDAIRNLLQDGKLEEKKGKLLIIATTDLVALGAMKELSVKEWMIPDHVMIMGIDDFEYARYVNLTSLKLHPERIGYTAAIRLVELAQTGVFPIPEPAPDGIGEITSRKSTGGDADQ